MYEKMGPHVVIYCWGPWNASCHRELGIALSLLTDPISPESVALDAVGHGWTSIVGGGVVCPACAAAIGETAHGN